MAALSLAGSFVFSIPSGALANWQYTHWGMSPDEVVKASNGKASLVSADVVARADKSYGRVKLAESTTHLDNIPLNVGFIFSNETRSLVEVGLYKSDCSNSDTSALESRLGTDYGLPLSRENLILLDRITWLDRSSSDRIVLVVFKGVDSTSCLVRVEPGASGSLPRRFGAPLRPEFVRNMRSETDPSTTLANLLMPLLVANPFSTMRASLRRQSSEEFEDGVAHGWQGRLRRRPVDSFFPALLLRAGDDDQLFQNAHSRPTPAVQPARVSEPANDTARSFLHRRQGTCHTRRRRRP
jgi:hypothetical protein